MTRYVDVWNAISTSFATNVATPESLVVVDANEADPAQPEDAAWVRLSPEWAVETIVTTAPHLRSRAPHAANAQLFVPLDTGSAEIHRLAQVIYDAFKGETVDDARFRAPYLQDTRREGHWWTGLVVMPFETDDTA